MTDAPLDDRAVLARVAGGDRDALEVLYRRHGGWLTSRLQSRCADPELADIAVQDTFLAAWKSAGKFRGDGDVGAWLWGIGIRRLIDVLRKRNATPIDPLAFASPLAPGTDPFAAATRDDVERRALGGDHPTLEAALRALPAELRAALIATAVDGLTTKEAARLLGVPQGTIKTRLSRARRQMQEALT